MAKLSRRKRREDVQSWSQHDGRHAFDPYLEDVMSLHAQGVDPAKDRSARIFVQDGKVMIVSTRRETLDEIGHALHSGRFGVIGKLAKRPDEDTLEHLLRDAPFSRGLPAPSGATRALPAHEGDGADESDADEGAQPVRAERRGRRRDE